MEIVFLDNRRLVVNDDEVPMIWYPEQQDLPNQIWFRGKNIQKITGEGNITQVLERVDANDKCSLKELTDRYGMPAEGCYNGITPPDVEDYNEAKANWVNESGLYAILLGSRKPECRKFQRYVTYEVLPKIRKFGHFELAAVPHGAETMQIRLYEAQIKETELRMQLMEQKAREEIRKAAEDADAAQAGAKRARHSSQLETIVQVASIGNSNPELALPSAIIVRMQDAMQNAMFSTDDVSARPLPSSVAIGLPLCLTGLFREKYNRSPTDTELCSFGRAAVKAYRTKHAGTDPPKGPKMHNGSAIEVFMYFEKDRSMLVDDVLSSWKTPEEDAADKAAAKVACNAAKDAARVAKAAAKTAAKTAAKAAAKAKASSACLS